MKRVYLQKITQYGTDCYIGKMDPRDLVKVAKKVEMSETQDAQRPLSAKRVKDIAIYVGEKGILPNTLTIATKDNRYEVNSVPFEGETMYYIDFPDKADEFDSFKESIDVMDGQHRLYSFNDDRKISDSESYEMGFTLYIKPTLDERRKIFISCNEKQEKVNGNLLMWFKSQLNMLTSDEKQFYSLVSHLNNEYPLKGHIIMSAEKVKSGVKAKEFMKVLDKAKVQNMTIADMHLSESQLVKVISIYLSAWEKVVGFSFSKPNAKTDGAAVKIAGLRFMVMVLPAVWDQSKTQQKKFDEAFVEETIKRCITECTYEEFFTCDENKIWFLERSQTEHFAEEFSNRVKSIGTDGFNPLD